MAGGCQNIALKISLHMNRIKAILATPKSLGQKESRALADLCAGQGVELEVARYTPLSYRDFDVAVVHQEMIKNGTPPEGARNLIILFDPKSSPHTIYHKARANGAAAALEFPFTGMQLTSLIREVYEEGLRQRSSTMSARSEGITIAVSSFKPGVGKSILAYNLASQMGHFMENASIGLIDLNVPLPASRALLDMEVSVGWDTIRPLFEDEKIIDRAKLTAVARTTPYGFALLTRSKDAGEEAPLTPQELSVLVESYKAHIPLTFFDMPSMTTLEGYQNLEVFDHVVIVVTPQAQCVANISHAAVYLRKSHPQLLKRMHFVLNQFEPKHEKLRHALEERLDISFMASVIDDPDAVETFTSKGKLFDDNSLIITRDLSNLAHALFKKVF